MLKRFMFIIILSLSPALFAQTTETEPTKPINTEATETTAGAMAMTHEIVTGGMLGVDDDTSSKFNEYRDISNGVRIFNLRLLGYRPAGATFFESTGRNLGGDDQFLSLRAGSYGSWSAAFHLDSLPHRIASEAASPYSYDGNGMFTVPAVVAILTTTPDNVNFRASDMLENDRRIAAYLNQYVRPLPDLGTDNDRLSLQFAWSPVAAFEARVGATRESREGEKISYGALGDRPPRTLNVELPEPIDYTETALQFDFAYAHRLFDVTLEVYTPEFENNVDTLRWQSMYFGPDSNGAADYNNDIILAGDAIVRRAVSTVGQRSLPPDNSFTNATLSVGTSTGMNGRFTATAAAGRLRQDETLLPYSYSSLTTDWNSTAKLPRLTADAAIDTLLVDLQYVFSPVGGLRLRPFARSYSLENDTPSARWHYVTSDTANNTTGSATYKNKRTNLAYAYARRNIGAEANWSARKTTLGLTVEQENVDRDFREADTDETIVRASASFRPLRRLNVRGRYTYGQRSADSYNTRITNSTYWYAPSEAGTDPDNPEFSFTNHPDMRRFDVSDRARNDFDLTATFNATDTLSFSANAMARQHDFDSDVAPVQPLAGTAFAGASGITPGIQLGLLSQDASRISFDANWNPTDRFGANIFVSLDGIDSKQRSLAYNEATRTSAQDPLVATAGQAWTSASNIWRADHEDRTTTLGAGFSYTLIPDRLEMSAEYALSNGALDIDYSGYGSDKPLNTTYYAWTSPETAEQNQQTASLQLDYSLSKRFVVGVRYLYDDYSLGDWMQEPSGGWVDEVNEYFVRDSTLDNRWGNRLPRLGGYLAPSYSANVGYVTLAYRW